MKRINIYEDGHYAERSYKGWFDLHAAAIIAKYNTEGAYVSGKILYATAKGKMVINHWNNTGLGSYAFAEDTAEICSILVAGGYDNDDKRMGEILDRYEI